MAIVHPSSLFIFVTIACVCICMCKKSKVALEKYRDSSSRESRCTQPDQLAGPLQESPLVKGGVYN